MKEKYMYAGNFTLQQASVSLSYKHSTHTCNVSTYMIKLVKCIKSIWLSTINSFSKSEVMCSKLLKFGPVRGPFKESRVPEAASGKAITSGT